MRLKKLYNRTTKAVGAKHEIAFVPSGKVRVLSAPHEQRFSTKFVEEGVKEGWLSISRNSLILVGDKGNVVYGIKRTPGRYPIKEPPGYEVIHYYDCVKEGER